MMKRITRLIAEYSLFIILGVSCQNANIVNTPTPTVTSESSPYQWSSWLAQPSCKPPCWESITPGVTTIDEATSILENMPGVEVDSKSPWGLSWRFGTKDAGGTIGGSEDRKVSFIWLGYSPNPVLPLEQVVAVYHFPEYVKPYDCDEVSMCSIALAYPGLGMMFSIYTKNTKLESPPKFRVLPEDVIERVYFFKPGMEFLNGFYVLEESEIPVRWKGYGEYP